MSVIVGLSFSVPSVTSESCSGSAFQTLFDSDKSFNRSTDPLGDVGLQRSVFLCLYSDFLSDLI